MSDYAKLLGPNGQQWHMRSENRKKATYGRQFVIIFPDGLIDLISTKKTDGSCIRVYMWALKALSHSKWSMFTMAEAGAELEVSSMTVSRAMAKLEDLGYVDKRGTRARLEWRLTPKGSWQGTAVAYQRECRERGWENPTGAALKLVHDSAQTDLEDFIEPQG